MPLGVFLGHEIVGHDRNIDAAAGQDRNQPLDQRRLAGADGTADADARGAGGRRRARGGAVSMRSCGGHRNI